MPGGDGTGPMGNGPIGGGRRGGRGRGAGQGRGGVFAGPGGSCVCPNCGTVIPHQVGIACTSQQCPKCGTAMVRDDAQ